MQALSGTSSLSSGPGDGAAMLPSSGTVGLRQQLTALMQQLAGLQQQQQLPGHQQGLQAFQPTAVLAGMLSSSQQATGKPAPAAECSLQAVGAGAGPLQRTTTNAGAILRTLSTANPRVLALAAAAAKASAGTAEHAAVLSALKDEVLAAANSTLPPAAVQPVAQAAAEPTRQLTVRQQQGPYDDNCLSPVASAQAITDLAGTLADTKDATLLPQQHPLTQDTLWAALMAKAAARAGVPSSSNPSSPHKPALKHEHSPTVLPGHGSTDSGMEAEGTICSLPWALLQAAAQAQEEEDEKEAARAAAAGADSPLVAASPRAEAAGAAEAEAAEASAGSPSRGIGSGSKGPSSSGAKSGSQVVFKRRSNNNSNALQRHFSKAAAGQATPSAPAKRTYSESAAVHKLQLQHPFKKQARKRPLLMPGGSSSNLVGLQSHIRPQQSPMLSAGRAGDQDSMEAACMHGPATGSLVTHALQDHAARPTMSDISLRAPAVTAPAAMGSGAVTDVLSFLATREQQLHMLQEQLAVHRRRLTAQPEAAARDLPSLTAALAGALSGAAAAPAAMQAPAAAAAVVSPRAGNNSAAAALAELQRMLGLSTPAPTAFGSSPAFAATMHCPGTRDVHMADAHDAAAAAAAPLQVDYGFTAQQQRMPSGSEDGHLQALTALKALASALATSQQQPRTTHMPPPPAHGGGVSGGSVAGDSELLCKLAAALQPLVG